MTPAIAKAPAACVAIATYVIVAGIFTQSGVILGPAAGAFHATLPATAVLFSYLNSGNLLGIAASLFVFPALTIRQALSVAYGVFFLGIALVETTHDLHVGCVAGVLIGMGAGTGLSVGAVIISKIFADRRRAIAFLATDCAFSAAGYVFPTLVGLALAAGWRWQSGYVFVAILPALLIVAASRIRFPAVRATAAPDEAQAGRTVAPASPRGALARIVIFGIALATYLTGQYIFTIWAPTDLRSHFAVPALRAGGIVGTFFGASSVGLISAALLVTRVAPRRVLIGSMSLAVILTFALAHAPNADLFFSLTLAFGFCSTCMFKLLISVGSEQLPAAPPRLVTFLLLCSGVGGIAAPIVSAPVVAAYGVHSSIALCCGAYAVTLILIGTGLLLERSGRQRGDAALRFSESQSLT